MKIKAEIRQTWSIRIPAEGHLMRSERFAEQGGVIELRDCKRTDVDGVPGLNAWRGCDDRGRVHTIVTASGDLSLTNAGWGSLHGENIVAASPEVALFIDLWNAAEKEGAAE